MEETREINMEMEETREITTGMAWETMHVTNGQADDLKEARKHFSKLGLMFFLGTLIIQVIQRVVVAIVAAVKPEWLVDPNINILLSIIPMYLLGMPALIALVKRVPAAKVEQHHMKAGHFVLAVFMSYAAMIVSNVVGLSYTVLISLLKGSFVNNEMASLVTSVNIFLLFLITVCCAPIYEEYIFRKLIVERTIGYGQGTAVLVSGLMFGLFHGNLNQFCYAFTLGMFLAFLYVKTGKLRVTIAIHMIVNFVGSVIAPLLLKAVDIDGYLELTRQGMDVDALMAYYLDNIIGWILYFFFGFCVFGVVLAGFVLFIVFMAKRRFTLLPGQVVIPRGKRFQTIIFNVGMILFCVFWIVEIIRQLLA